MGCQLHMRLSPIPHPGPGEVSARGLRIPRGSLQRLSGRVEYIDFLPPFTPSSHLTSFPLLRVISLFVLWLLLVWLGSSCKFFFFCFLRGSRIVFWGPMMKNHRRSQQKKPHPCGGNCPFKTVDVANFDAYQ